MIPSSGSGLPSEPPDGALDPAVLIETSVPQVVAPIAGGRRILVPPVLRLLVSDKKALGGLIVLGVISLLAVLAPLLTRYDPTAMSGDLGVPPGAQHWFGTSDQGNDIFSQVVYGARTSLLLGSAAAILATLIATSMGMLAAYVGGIIDDGLNLVTNVFLVIPALPVLIVVSSYLPFRGGIVIVVLIAFTSWAGEARMLRSFALTLRSRDFVLACRVSGDSTWHIVFGEIMPNMTSRIVAGFLGAFVGAIFYEASLEFLGFGGSDGVSWGTILFWAQNNATLETGEWWHFLFPGMALAITATALIFINYGVDQVSNPRLQSVKMPRAKQAGESTATKRRAAASGGRA